MATAWSAVDRGRARLLNRNGHDWTHLLPTVTKAISQLPVEAAMLDGELVAVRDDGISSFPDLQASLKAGRDDRLIFYAFDLLHLNGWDLRPCALIERKRVLSGLADWAGMLRYSDHLRGQTHEMRRAACQMHLEGIICKQADAPYRGGRGRSWVKLKCAGREELAVLGWTPPGVSRIGIGALHVGYFDPEGRLHYAGGVGTGFSEQELATLRNRLTKLKAAPPDELLIAGDPIDRAIQWVRPELVVEVQYTAWSGAGRGRHPVYLGLREDKTLGDVVREVADPAATRRVFVARPGATGAVGRSRGW